MQSEDKYKIGRLEERKLWLAMVKTLGEQNHPLKPEFSSYAAMLLHNVMVRLVEAGIE